MWSKQGVEQRYMIINKVDPIKETVGGHLEPAICKCGTFEIPLP